LSNVRLLLTGIILLVIVLALADKFPNYAIGFMALVLLGVLLANADIILKGTK